MRNTIVRSLLSPCLVLAAAPMLLAFGPLNPSGAATPELPVVAESMPLPQVVPEEAAVVEAAPAPRVPYGFLWLGFDAARRYDIYGERRMAQAYLPAAGSAKRRGLLNSAPACPSDQGPCGSKGCRPDRWHGFFDCLLGLFQSRPCDRCHSGMPVGPLPEVRQESKPASTAPPPNELVVPQQTSTSVPEKEQAPAATSVPEQEQAPAKEPAGNEPPSLPLVDTAPEPPVPPSVAEPAQLPPAEPVDSQPEPVQSAPAPSTPQQAPNELPGEEPPLPDPQLLPEPSVPAIPRNVIPPTAPKQPLPRSSRRPMRERTLWALRHGIQS